LSFLKSTEKSVTYFSSIAKFDAKNEKLHYILNYLTAFMKTKSTIPFFTILLMSSIWVVGCGDTSKNVNEKSKEQARVVVKDTVPLAADFTSVKSNFTDKTAGLNLSMVFVQGGHFLMGDTFNDQEYSNETPVHTVSLDGFFVGKTEVTQAQWKIIMGKNPSHFRGDNLPVESVSFGDVQTFLTKLNKKTKKKYRLLSEAEWEFAARERGRSVRFGNGKDTCDIHINMEGTSAYQKSYSLVSIFRGKTLPVGSFAPNALGLYDMSGNVLEWCSDCFQAYSPKPQANPRIAEETGTYRNVRGGSWGSSPRLIRAACRNYSVAKFRGNNTGFRLALSM
jgi:formylglycine-generating enzyme required for sulfatase activity